MTGFQNTPWVCPCDTQKPGFSYICSSSLSAFSLSIYLSPSLYSQRFHLQSVFIWTGRTCEMCDSQYKSSEIKVHRFLRLWSKTVAQPCPPPVLVVNFMERLSVSLHFYGSHCSNLSSFLVKWWSHCDCKSPVVKRFRLLNYSFQFACLFFVLHLPRNAVMSMSVFYHLKKVKSLQFFEFDLW